MADKKITVLAKIRAKDAMVEKVKEELLCLVTPTRSEPGCISYDLHQASDNKSLFMFYENWTSKKALDEHLQTPYLRAFIARAETILAEPLDVSIWEKLS